MVRGYEGRVVPSAVDWHISVLRWGIRGVGNRRPDRAMTARQIIESRLGRKLPAPKDMRPVDRKAVKTLAIQLIKKRKDPL